MMLLASRGAAVLLLIDPTIVSSPTSMQDGAHWAAVLGTELLCSVLRSGEGVDDCLSSSLLEGPHRCAAEHRKDSCHAAS